VKAIYCHVEPPEVDIIIPTLNFRAALDNYHGWPDPGVETWWLTVMVDEKQEGFTRTVNRGLAETKSPYICIIGDDAVPETEGWLLELRKALEEGYGFAFPTMPCRTAPISKARRASPTGQLVEIPHGPYGCVLMKREVLGEVGLLDEAFAHYGSDVDHQRRSSFKSVWVAHVYVRRELHEPREPWWTEDGIKFRERWGDR